MMKTRKMSVMQRVICGLLVIVSLLLLMFGTCVRLHDWSDIAGEIESLMSLAEYYGRWMGLDIDVNGIRNVNRAMSDGKISASDTFTIAWEAGDIIDEALKINKDSDLNRLKSYCLLYDVVFITTLVLAAAAAIGYFAGKPKAFPILYIVMVFALFMFFMRLDDEATITPIPALALCIAVLAPCFRGMTSRSQPRPAKKATKSLPAESDIECDFIVAETLGGERPKGTAVGTGAKEGIRDRLIGSTKDGGKAVKEQLGYMKDQLGQRMTRKSAQAAYCTNCGCRNDGDARYCEHCGKPL